MRGAFDGGAGAAGQDFGNLFVAEFTTDDHTTASPLLSSALPKEPAAAEHGLAEELVSRSESVAESLEVSQGAAGKADAPSPEFVELFVKNQRRLYLFLLAQTADSQAAEEILQNANVVIWSKWMAFQPGTNFLAWAFRIASLEFLKYRQRAHRSRLQFDEEFINTVAEAVEQLNEQQEARRQALAVCLGKLRPRDREMIQLRYQLGNDGKLLADQLQRPVNSIYQSLGRIRRILLECIEREIATVNR